MTVVESQVKESHDIHSDPWSIVSLAFFLRYPNPYAAHVLSCDVISRTHTPQGTLFTTRLILKKGSLPKWAPKGIINRAESWILEESEVDPSGRVVRCKTRNLDHVKVMRVEEITTLRQVGDGWVIFGGLSHDSHGPLTPLSLFLGRLCK